jgi:hypothetical protein
MAIVATAIPSVDITYTLKDTDAVSTLSETTSAGYPSLQFTHGTGTGNIDIAVVITGSINSGENIVFDFREFPKSVFGKTISLNFSSDTDAYPNPLTMGQKGIKSILVSNGWNGISNSGLAMTGLYTTGNAFFGYPIHSGLPQLNVHATGDDGFSGLFGNGTTQGVYDSIGGSGNISINPSGSWAYTDIIGKTPIYDVSASVYQHKLTISAEGFTDIKSSGALSSGTSGDIVYYPIWNDTTSGSPWSGNVATIPYQIAIVGVTGIG